MPVTEKKRWNLGPMRGRTREEMTTRFLFLPPSQHGTPIFPQLLGLMQAPVSAKDTGPTRLTCLVLTQVVFSINMSKTYGSVGRGLT